MRQRALLLLLLSGACEASAPAPRPTPQRSESARAPTESIPASPVRSFGAAPKLSGPPLPVEQLLASPEPYLGKTVRCEGKVGRVCQNAGCWLELAAEGGEGLRVPMAGHAFFIPQDAVGKIAVIEGELRRHELPAHQREHYQGEGMRATGPLSLEATSVVLR